MISFDKDYYDKFQNAKITGTGYLAFRDVPQLIQLYDIGLQKVLDLGCGSGRSTIFLKNLTSIVYASDISEYAIELIKANITSKAFVNTQDCYYENFPYASVFAFFTFLHLTTKQEILNEYKKCFNSLEKGGHLIIVHAHENLFYKNYESVLCENNLDFKEGIPIKIKLKKIDCEILNCYWSYITLIELAQYSGLQLLGIHFPLGRSDDKQHYLDEYHYAPYVCLTFKKP